MQHAPVVVVLLEGRQHVSGLYALAYGIGQYAFESVAHFEAYLPLVEYEEYQQDVVVLFLAYAPMAEQLVGERFDIVFTYRFEYDDGHLGGGAVSQRVESQVDEALGLRAEYAVGVGYEPPGVGLLYMGDTLYGVFGGLCRAER